MDCIVFFSVLLGFAIIVGVCKFCCFLKRKYGSYLKKSIVFSLLGAVLVFSTNPSAFAYICFVGLLLLAFFASYSFDKNSILSAFGSVVLLVNLGLYLLTKFNIKEIYYEICEICFNIKDVVLNSDTSILKTLYIFYFLALLVIFFRSLKNNESSQVSEPKINIFSERDEDLKRVKFLIEQHYIIGVDSSWGNGKTFFFKNIIPQDEEFKQNYHIVSISVLSMQTEQVETFVVGELAALLECEGVFSNVSRKMQSVLNHSFFNGLGRAFFGANSYEASVNELKIDAQKLDKKIILTFEDLDRIDEKAVILKVLAFGEALACDKIRIVFQYSEEKLLKILDKPKIYLEKYIPHTMQLTQISMISMICAVLKNGTNKEKYEKAGLKADDFNFLNNILTSNFIQQCDVFFQCSEIQIRKVEILLINITNALPKYLNDIKDKSNSQQVKKLIILYFIIQLCDYDFFNIVIRDGICKNLAFNRDGICKNLAFNNVDRIQYKPKNPPVLEQELYNMHFFEYEQCKYSKTDLTDLKQKENIINLILKKQINTNRLFFVSTLLDIYDGFCSKQEWSSVIISTIKNLYEAGKDNDEVKNINNVSTKQIYVVN